ncbi:MAG: aminotransferase class IV [Saprospiraceae bacterium]
MAQVNLNGKLISAETAHVPIVNRALSYGDGLFETIRAFSGKMPFLSYHYQRLIAGLKQLMFTVPDDWTLGYLYQEIRRTMPSGGNHRIRVTVWRSGGGLYLPQSQQPRFLIEAIELADSQFTLNPLGIVSDVSQSVILARHAWSSSKTLNAIPYVLAAIEKKKRNLDELFLRNDLKEIAEGGAANVFILTDGKFYTPDLSSGCIAGVTRAIVIEIIVSMGMDLIETPLMPEDLEAADCIFVTNSISGLRWIRKFKDTTYTMHPVLEEINQELNNRVESYKFESEYDNTN